MHVSDSAPGCSSALAQQQLWQVISTGHACQQNHMCIVCQGRVGGGVPHCRQKRGWQASNNMPQRDLLLSRTPDPLLPCCCAPALQHAPAAHCDSYGQSGYSSRAARGRLCHSGGSAAPWEHQLCGGQRPGQQQGGAGCSTGASQGSRSASAFALLMHMNGELLACNLSTTHWKTQLSVMVVIYAQ